MSLLGWLFGARDDVDEAGDLTEDGHPFDLDCGCDECAQEWRCAVHEAGHVIAADARGWPWEYDRVRGEPHVWMVHDSDDMTAPDDAYDYLIIFHAGHAAEQAVFGAISGSSSDLEELPKLAARVPSPTAYDDAWEEAAELVAGNLAELEEFAEALFTEGTIYS